MMTSPYACADEMAAVTKKPTKTKKRPRRAKHPAALTSIKPNYVTKLGAAYRGDALDLLKSLPDKSVNAIVTSPPYALYFKKSYGNPSAKEYVDWFMPFAKEFRRVLRSNGSLVIEIGGAWNRGLPTRSIYHFELLVRLVKEAKFHLAEEFFWFNRARMPSPAEWVNVRRIRVKDAVTPIWWLSPTPWPSANNKRVLRDYSPDMLRLFKNGYNGGTRPSGHVAKAFEKNNGGAIPPNLIEVAHTSSKDGYQDYCRERALDTHPARFPKQVPEFFIKFLSRKNGLVLDPFSGSNMTGYVAEKLGRRWMAFELNSDYVRGSVGRFLGDKDLPTAVKRGRSFPSWIRTKDRYVST
jgi:site-specific DNA-methyltransferase (cytosine-N4-specific)